ncbi:MAG: Gfo/Idh/MocA family protein [Planctomycetota bacterium]|jgi:predicted dehydrogenase
MVEGARRIGIVGAGNISRLHLEGIARHPERATVAALADPDRATREARAAEFGIDRTFATVGEMLAGAEFDAAIVCTPTHVREDVVLPLIEAGVPLLCEKPFAEGFAEAARIERASREAGVAVALNQNFRRHFSFALAREALARGELGRPLHLAQTACGLRRDAGWRLDRRRYVMAVMSIHWFDGYRFMLGEEPRTAYCRGVDSPATPGGADTAVSAVLEFPSGAVACLSESFSSFTGAQSCTLDCERGGLTMGYKSMTEVREGDERVEHPNPFDKAEATWWLLDDLLSAVEEGRAPETSAADNLKSMRILEAAYRSLEERREVRVEEVQ